MVTGKVPIIDPDGLTPTVPEMFLSKWIEVPKVSPEVGSLEAKTVSLPYRMSDVSEGSSPGTGSKKLIQDPDPAAVVKVLSLVLTF